MQLHFSIIIPVYNRPKEIEELLQSLAEQDFKDDFEVLVVEDGSTNTSDEIVTNYQDKLAIQYFFKENSGAGASRNYGMKQAIGNYFIILDSDVIIPTHYLFEIKKTLSHNFTNAFGGPDKAHESFSTFQKAINYAMTSLLTTGGIRGKKKAIGKFQPRSFNMGVSRKAFEATKGFSKMKAGEDIDFTFRLWEQGFDTQLIENAFVYHKRRTNLRQFFKQTFAFGSARPILNRKYPESRKITYWFPSVFIVGLLMSLVLLALEKKLFFYAYLLYFFIILIDASIQNKSFKVGSYSVLATITQFTGYGLGFLKSFFKNQPYR